MSFLEGADLLRDWKEAALGRSSSGRVGNKNVVAQPVSPVLFTSLSISSADVCFCHGVGVKVAVDIGVEVGVGSRPAPLFTPTSFVVILLFMREHNSTIRKGSKELCL